MKFFAISESLSVQLPWFRKFPVAAHSDLQQDQLKHHLLQEPDLEKVPRWQVPLQGSFLSPLTTQILGLHFWSSPLSEVASFPEAVPALPLTSTLLSNAWGSRSFPLFFLHLSFTWPVPIKSQLKVLMANNGFQC